MRCHRRSACSTRISANARPPLSQLRARPLSQLVSVPPRRRYLGNCMYPNVATLVGDALAGKVTGMLLELPTPTIVALVASYDELKRAVGDAVAVLPPEMLDQLGGSAEHPAEQPSPNAISPASVMAREPGTTAWGDDDEDDDLPPVVDLFASAEQRKRLGAAAAAAPEAFDAMETDESSGFVCEWDAQALAAEPSETVSDFIATRLAENQVRGRPSGPRGAMRVRECPLAEHAHDSTRARPTRTSAQPRSADVARAGRAERPTPSIEPATAIAMPWSLSPMPIQRIQRGCRCARVPHACRHVLRLRSVSCGRSWRSSEPRRPSGFSRPPSGASTMAGWSSRRRGSHGLPAAST